MINTKNGSQIWSRLIKSKNKPILSNEVIYVLSDSDLLICLDKKNGEIIWSKNIYSDLLSSKKRKLVKKIVYINHLYLTSNKLLLISKNAYAMEFNSKNGKLLKINKLSAKPYLKPLFANGNLYITTNKNKILGLN